MICQQNVLFTHLNSFLQYLTPHNRNLVIAFLHPQDIELIVRVLRPQYTRDSFVTCLYIRHFVQSYLTRTDRSIYIPFYAEKGFLKIQFQQLSFLCNHSSPSLLLLANSFERLFQRLHSQLNAFQYKDQILASIRDSLTDPELPFPKLRKESVGMHCNSSFQYFLIDQHFPKRENDQLEESLEKLKHFLLISEEKPYEEWQILIMGEVFRGWSKINFQNYEHFLTGMVSHNIVVIVLALLDLLIDCFHTYLQSIQDPLQAFAEFNLRYCIFRNVVLSLEEKLNFIFQTQTSFCQNLQGSDKNMSLWHCALSRWYFHMHGHHNQCSSTFFYLLKKINLKAICNQTIAQANTNPLFIELQNCLQLKQGHILDRQHHFQLYSPIEDYFDKDLQLYPQLIKQFVEYLIDMSVDKNSVHWCGHSNQALYLPYQEFQRQLVASFEIYLRRIIDVGREVSQSLPAICVMVSTLVTELDKEYLKSTTLLKFIQTIEKQLASIINQQNQQIVQLQEKLHGLRQELLGRDRVLEHFNQQIQVPNEVSVGDCILIDNSDIDQCLKTSGSTNDSQNHNGYEGLNLQMKLSQSEDDFS